MELVRCQSSKDAIEHVVHDCCNAVAMNAIIVVPTPDQMAGFIAYLARLRGMLAVYRRPEGRVLLRNGSQIRVFRTQDVDGVVRGLHAPLICYPNDLHADTQARLTSRTVFYPDEARAYSYASYEPVANEELAAIMAEDHENVIPAYAYEIDQLTAENAAMRQIITGLAALEPKWMSFGRECGVPEEQIDPLIEQARAILSGSGA